MLDILPAPDEKYIPISDIKKRLELPGKDEDYNWSSFVIEEILNKLMGQFKAQPKVTQTDKGVERRIGWRLSKKEYQKRLDNKIEVKE